MPENDAFSRDLGYLDKFFDKLEAHAGTLPSDAGERLRALLAGERKTWAEIRQLVGVAGAPAAAAPSAPAPAPAPTAAEKPAAAEPRPYTRALQAGMAQLASLPPTAAPMAEGAAATAAGRTPAGTTAFPRIFSVGSLKPRR